MEKNEWTETKWYTEQHKNKVICHIISFILISYKFEFFSSCTKPYNGAAMESMARITEF